MAKVLFSGGSRAWANNLNDLRERWHIRREEPVSFTVPVHFFKEDVQNLSREELLALKNELIKLINDGKKTLHKAESTARFEGVYLEPEKYNDLKFTVKAIDVHIQETNRALSKIKERIKQGNRERDKIFERRFIDAARKMLPKELYLKLVDKANEEEE